MNEHFHVKGALPFQPGSGGTGGNGRCWPVASDVRLCDGGYRRVMAAAWPLAPELLRDSLPVRRQMFLLSRSTTACGEVHGRASRRSFATGKSHGRAGQGAGSGRPSHPAGTPATGGVQHHMILAGRCGAADFVLPERRAHERIRTSLDGPTPRGAHDRDLQSTGVPGPVGGQRGTSGRAAARGIDRR